MSNYLEILSHDKERLELLAKELGVHPLALEDCFHRDQRPKLDDYQDHQLLVWFFSYQFTLYELQFLIFPKKLILVPHQLVPKGEDWKSFLKINQNPNALYQDVWHQLYQALDSASDYTAQDLKALRGQIDHFEARMFVDSVQPEQMLQLKRKLNHLEYSLSHLPSVAEQLQNLIKPKGEMLWKLRDLHDHCERISARLLYYRNDVATNIELYWGLQSHRSNIQIKKLSLLASIALPLTFWSSFWGMNFEIIPYGNHHFFLIALGLMLLSAFIALWVVIKKGYWSQ